MIPFAFLFAVALGAAHAQRPEVPTERFVPYRRLPADVQAMVSSVIGEACAIDSRHAEMEATAVRLFRADLDGDGTAD
jgi:DNA-binding helix-hairpin-helix protein with protein kinase domain